MDRQLIDYLPAYFAKFREVKALMAAEQPEIELLWQEVMQGLNNQFVTRANIQGIKLFEEIYGIVPRSDEGLEERRFAVLAKMNIQPPYTEKYLRRQLDFLCGEDGYKLDIKEFLLNIKLELKSKHKLNVIEEMLKTILPCNMELYISIIYNTNKVLGRYTHRQLAALSHGDIRNEVIDIGD